MRYIIECEDPTDIILGMHCVKELIKLEKEEGSNSAIIGFTKDDLWYVKKTKTGYSARKSR